MISHKLFFIVLLLIACLFAVSEAQWGYGYRPYGGYGGYGGFRRPYRPWGYRPYGYGWGK